MAQLNKEQFLRFSRHLVLPEVGEKGQQKLLNAKVLCVGAGGLGSPALLYLAAAGVGKIGVIDGDKVELSNLQRQILYNSEQIGQSKAEIAAQKLKALNPGCEVKSYNEFLTKDNGQKIVSEYDIVLDGSDNFKTRYLLNKICVELKKPHVYGSIYQFEGQCSVLAPHLGAPCYSCLYQNPPPEACMDNCAEGGVLGVLPGVVGSLQATEVLKLILGIGEPLLGRMLVYDALTMQFNELRNKRRDDCLVCGTLKKDSCCMIDFAESENSKDKFSLSISEARKETKDGVVFLDVRKQGAYEVAGLSGVKIPFHELKKRWQEIKDVKDKKIIVYCHSGVNSKKAVRLLRDKGMDNVYNLEGGVVAWLG